MLFIEYLADKLRSIHKGQIGEVCLRSVSIIVLHYHGTEGATG